MIIKSNQTTSPTPKSPFVTSLLTKRTHPGDFEFSNNKLEKKCAFTKDAKSFGDLAISALKKTENKASVEKGFCWMLVGKPGSGKSHLISKILKERLKGKFASTFFFTPTKIDGLNLVKDQNWFPQFTWNQIQECISYAAKTHPTKPLLLVFDDIIATLREHGCRKELMNLVFNRRHLISEEAKDMPEVSILLTTQKYMACPDKIRTCLTHLCVFRVQGNDMNKIKNECIYNDSRALYRLCDEHWKGTVDQRNKRAETHNFIYLDLTSGKMFLNFDKEVQH